MQKFLPLVNKLMVMMYQFSMSVRPAQRQEFYLCWRFFPLCMFGSLVIIFIKLFVSGFLIDFIIRLFINPNYAPTLILGKLITHQQKVEYTGAPQKRFAWTLGLLMSLYMFYSLVVMNQVSVLTCLLCVICLTLLFFETAFGICLGCLLYNATHKDKAHFCPGGVCEVHQVAPVQRTGALQLLLVALFALAIWWLANSPWVRVAQSTVSGQDCLLNHLPGKSENETYNCSILE